MDEEFIRNRITELRLKKGVSEYQMSMELGQNRSYIQAISSGRSMPSMKQFLNICEYFEITPLQFFDAQENNPQLIKKALDGMRKMSDDDLIKELYDLMKNVLQLRGVTDEIPEYVEGKMFSFIPRKV